MKFSLYFNEPQFKKVQLIAIGKLSKAATGALHQVVDLAKQRARATIDLPGGWKNALRATVYPKNNISLEPAAVIKHNIPYADVFEEGATIAGSPLLWIPLPSANIPRGPHNKQSTPADLVAAGVELISLKNTAKPILAAVIRETDARAAKPLSRSLLKRARNAKGRGTLRVVPMFVGVPSITDPKRMDIVRAIKEAVALYPAFYIKEFA